MHLLDETSNVIMWSSVLHFCYSYTTTCACTIFRGVGGVFSRGVEQSTPEVTFSLNDPHRTLLGYYGRECCPCVN